jgi:glucose-6-phosphate isomerase
MILNFETNADHSNKSFSLDFLNTISKKFHETINREDIGFFQLTENKEHLKSTKIIFEKYKDRKHFVQIGIGGSALGPQMLIDALGKKDCGKTFTFLDNTDSEYISDELSIIDPKESLFYVVSKSGGTAETMACFAICRQALIECGVKEEDFNKYFVFSTDPVKSDLRDLANDKGFDALEIPSNIGGRFSVLTSVGLLPALFAGIDIDQLYAGAENIKKTILEDASLDNPLYRAGAELAFAFIESDPKVNQTILMPYSSKLKSLSSWFVQLWGESLGKYSEDKKTNTGLTPIPAYGATDQHSQMQLFMEGTNDKFLFLLELESKNVDFNLQNSIGKSSSDGLNGYTLNQLMEAQLHGTIKALRDRERNICHIKIDKNNEYNLGALIVFFESLTALMGHYLFVDPFNQPGVELGKKYAYEFLSKKSK